MQFYYTGIRKIKIVLRVACRYQEFEDWHFQQKEKKKKLFGTISFYLAPAVRADLM